MLMLMLKCDVSGLFTLVRNITLYNVTSKELKYKKKCYNIKKRNMQNT